MILLLFILGLVSLIFSLVFKYSVSIGAAGEVFKTEAKIVMINVEDYSSMVTPIVEFKDKGELVRSSMSMIANDDCPSVGSTISVFYKRNELSNGKTTYQVWSDNEKQEKIMSILKKIYPILMIVSIILLLLDVFLFIKWLFLK